MLFTFDELDLSGTDALSSSSITSSMITDGAAEGLVRSGVSSGDTLDSFNKGELRAYSVPHPFWGVDIGVLAGLLKERIAWLRGCDGPGHGLAEPNG